MFDPPLASGIPVPEGVEAHDSQLEPAARRRLRVTFSAAGAIAVLYLLLPVLAAFTSVLDGDVGGVGIAYILGFVQIVLVMVVAVGYCLWANRAEREGDL